VRDGQTTFFDLDLSKGAACKLRGRLTVDGRPATSWTVSLRPEERRVFTTPPSKSALDARGEFALEADTQGAYLLELESPPEAIPVVTLTQTVDLAPGEHSFEANLQTARVAGASDLGAAPLLFRIRCADATAVAAASPDAEGRFGPLTLPAGALEVLRLEPGGAGQGTWGLCQRAELKPGVTLDLDLP